MPGKPKVIIYATCQGEYLANLLRLSPEFCQSFDLEYHSNIIRPGVFNSDGIEYSSIADCSFFFYHQVRSPKNSRVVGQVLELLPAMAKSVALPYITSNLYWPLCETRYLPIGAGPERPEGVFPYAWPLVDKMLEAGHSPARIAALFYRLDPGELVDLAQLQKSTFAYWKMLDEQGEIKVYDFLMSNWRGQMLFYLYNHPSRPVFMHLAGQILDILGLPRLDEAGSAEAYLAQDQVYPVHPALAKSLGLTFVAESSRYHYKGHDYSLYSFLRRYLDVKIGLAQGRQAA